MLGQAVARRMGRAQQNPSLSRRATVRQNRRGDCVMDATLILIDSAAELSRARALVDRLWELGRSGRHRTAAGASTPDRSL